ncbi:unnamed protein product [Callosobruchus maculatus]|uniref:Uncharacterized protein n=1 Tax=Callosobruchus maculatus TaxID=64391 RepID=A0A653C4P6_CALMS|nr:unnamed protein product [Callosobruchus maculatus]
MEKVCFVPSCRNKHILFYSKTYATASIVVLCNRKRRYTKRTCILLLQRPL